MMMAGPQGSLSVGTCPTNGLWRDLAPGPGTWTWHPGGQNRGIMSTLHALVEELGFLTSQV